MKFKSGNGQIKLPLIPPKNYKIARIEFDTPKRSNQKNEYYIAFQREEDFLWQYNKILDEYGENPNNSNVSFGKTRLNLSEVKTVPYKPITTKETEGWI